MLDTSLAGPRSIRGGIVRTGGYVLGLALTIASAPLLIRHLGVVTFGEYVTAVSVMTITTGVTEGGLQSLALREYSVLEGHTRRDLMRAMLGLRIVLSAVGVAAGVIFAIVAGYRDVLVIGALIAGLGLALTSIQILIAVPLQAALRNNAVTALDLGRQVLTVLLIVVLVLAGASLLPFLGVLAVAAVPPLVAGAWLVRDGFPLRPSMEPRRWRGLLADMLPFAGVSIVAVVYLRLTVVTLSLVSSGEETGYFATAFRVVEAFLGIPGILVATVFPILARAARDDTARLRYAMDRVLRVSLIGGAWLALALSLGADFIVQVLAGDEGDPAVDVLRIQSLSLLPVFVGSACGFALLSLRRQRAVMAAIGLGLVINLALTVVLGAAHGAVGAAIAITVADVVIAVTALTLLIRSSAEMRFPLRPMLPVIPAAAAGAAFALTGLPSLVQAIAASVVYFAILLALRAIPPEVAEAVLRRSPQERNTPGT